MAKLIIGVDVECLYKDPSLSVLFLHSSESSAFSVYVLWRHNDAFLA